MKASDLIAFSGRGLMSDVINIATYGIPRWGISHVGILARYGGRLVMFESTTLDDLPCEIQKKRVKGVQAHGLDAVLKGYEGRIWLYPLYRELYPAESRRLTRFLVDLLGRPYDEIGAIRSAGIGFSWIESLLHGENLASIFCSEIDAGAYSTVGIMPSSNVSRWNPNRLVRHLRRHEILRRPVRLK